MPRKLSRRARSERLLKLFLTACKARVKRDRKRRVRERRTLRSLELRGELPSPDSSQSYSDSSISVLSLDVLSSSDPSDSETSDSDNSSTSSSSGGTTDTDSSSGSQTSEDLEEEMVLMEVDAELNGMPELVHNRLFDDDDDSEDGWGDSSSESEEDSESDSELESGNDGDDEELWDDGMPSSFGPGIAKRVRDSIMKMYSTRYEEPRDVPRSRPPPQIHHCLEVTKAENPEEFREILRVTPLTFDKLVEKIENDPIFFNNSNNPQLPVEQQLAIALYRFGHDGNAAG